MEELAPFADGTGLPWALAAVHLGRALPRRPGGSRQRAVRECARPPRTPDRPYDRARTQLAYGEFLRRTQRRVDARTHLRAALETFEDLRADPLAERAGQELRASGETARKRDPSTR